MYFEWLASYNANRNGIEVIDGTQGGSTLGMTALDVAASDGAMDATVADVGDSSVLGWFDRSDIDAAFVQQGVNGDLDSVPDDHRRVLRLELVRDVRADGARPSGLI